jgi:hypothetical protein
MAHTAGKMLAPSETELAGTIDITPWRSRESNLSLAAWMNFSCSQVASWLDDSTWCWDLMLPTELVGEFLIGVRGGLPLGDLLISDA